MKYYRLMASGRYGVQWQGNNLKEIQELLPKSTPMIEHSRNQLTLATNGQNYVLDLGDWIMGPLIPDGDVETFTNEYVKKHYELEHSSADPEEVPEENTGTVRTNSEYWKASDFPQEGADDFKL